MGEPTWTREKLRRLVHREIGDYKLIVVSNRQPYVHDLIGGELRYASPAGGLTTAIDPLMQECGGTWVAYGGGRGDWLAVDAKNRIQVPLTTRLTPYDWSGLRSRNSRVTTMDSPMKDSGRSATTPS